VNEAATIDQNLVRALGHPMRVRVLEALQGRTASPNELAREFAESLGAVAYHFGVLRQADCVEEVRTLPRRGAVEHFYTARPRSFIGHQDWRRAPVSVRGGVTSQAVRTFVAKVGAAIDADTIDPREDTILHWASVSVDEPGWTEITRILDQALVKVAKAAGRSRERLGDADGIPVVTGLAAFEAAPDLAVGDPPGKLLEFPLRDAGRSADTSIPEDPSTIEGPPSGASGVGSGNKDR
jgi:DNA-binding transcriptional ArsR family regulator